MIEKTINYAPAVSIGMPVYNGEKYIREALDSLLAQTFENFELIISDNCSTDGTSHICKEYTSRDSRIRYIRQDTNIGPIANFEFVLQEARGEFFMWAACDDYLENNNYLSVMVNTMQGRYDFCFPSVKLQLENAVKKTISDGIMDRFSSCVSTHDYCKQTALTCSYQIYGLFKRNFLIVNFKYIAQCKHLRCFGEGLFVHAITANSLLTYVPAASLVYRRHEGNVSSTQEINHLLVDFYKFTYMLILFYIQYQNFNCVQKLSIFSKIFLVHGKYFLILLYGFLTQFIINLFKVLNINLSSFK